MTGDPADPIRPAATILLLRDEPAFEVLMVKRHHQIDFAAGALVFPGGKSHAGDHDPAWADHATGWESVEADGAPLRIAAIREGLRGGRRAAGPRRGGRHLRRRGGDRRAGGRGRGRACRSWTWSANWA